MALRWPRALPSAILTADGKTACIELDTTIRKLLYLTSVSPVQQALTRVAYKQNAEGGMLPLQIGASPAGA